MAGVIEIEGLRKRFGEVEAVVDVTLSVGAAEAFGYLGPNGAGKTTTIRCLLGFIRPTAGRVRIFGKDIASHLTEILNDVGYLPGEFGLWPAMTGQEVLDYLGALHPASPSQQSALCDRFELAQADLDRQVRFYSRGMRQKIGLVQAFQHAPSLVILDEPSEGLDPVMQDRFVSLLRDHKASGGTTFMSSHILSEVERATDHVGVVKAGRLVKTGAARDLTGERMRHCTLTLKDDAPDGLLDLPGVANVVSRNGTLFRFEYRGDMEPLLRRLGSARVLEFLAEPESLADAFFDVYGAH